MRDVERAVRRSARPAPQLAVPWPPPGVTSSTRLLAAFAPPRSACPPPRPSPAAPPPRPRARSTPRQSAESP
eukprot:6655529-Pyramimonas_sp.AAC.3